MSTGSPSSAGMLAGLLLDGLGGCMHSSVFTWLNGVLRSSALSFHVCGLDRLSVKGPKPLSLPRLSGVRPVTIVLVNMKVSNLFSFRVKLRRAARTHSLLSEKY
jgi:hypothetical protein